MKSLEKIRLAGKLLNGHAPGQLIVQMTDACNATCPQCGMRATNRFKRTRIEPEKIMRAIDRFAENGGVAISFTGGEPFLYFEDLLGFIAHAEKRGIKYIRTGTNGFFMKNPESPDFEDQVKRIAGKLAKTGIHNIWISIDSSDPETHEKMRGLEGVVKGIEKALPIFHSFGIYPSANLGINRNMAGFNKRLGSENQDVFFEKTADAFRDFYRFVIDLGFSIANCCYPMSVNSENENLSAVYAATSDDITKFESWEKIQIYKALFEVIPEFRNKIRIFSPRSSLHALINQHEGNTEKSFPCLGGIDFFFISATDGLAYPCGYRGNECLGDYAGIDFKKISTEPYCRECDWECFRDPSELFSPFIQMAKTPLKLMKKYSESSEFFKIWAEDLKYYRACNFFDGRRP